MKSAASLLFGVVCLLTVPATATAVCPNEEIRAEQGTVNLPDCLAYEMVTPPQKLG
jgi:hypothetical protein